MNKRVKYLIHLIVLIITIICLVQLMKYIDYNRVIDKKQPLFCYERRAYLDGGSLEWRGLGYAIFDIDSTEGYQNVKVGNWKTSISDFTSKEKEQNLKKLNIYMDQYNPKEETTGSQGIRLNGYSDEGRNIIDIISKAEFDNDTREYENSNYIIIIETIDSRKSYFISSKDEDTYLIDKDIGKAKLNKEDISTISKTLKRYNEYYGDTYKIRNKIILTAIIAMIVIINIIVLIIMKRKIK